LIPQVTIGAKDVAGEEIDCSAGWLGDCSRHIRNPSGFSSFRPFIFL
jgi:hypothetical protein